MPSLACSIGLLGVFRDDGEDVRGRRAVLPPAVGSGKGVVQLLRTLAVGAQEAPDDLGPAVRDLRRREHRLVLPRRLVADIAHDLHGAAIDRRRDRRRRHHRGIGLAAGHRRDRVRHRLHRQNPDALQIDAVFLGDQRGAVMRRRADLRHRDGMIGHLLERRPAGGMRTVGDDEGEELEARRFVHRAGDDLDQALAAHAVERAREAGHAEIDRARRDRNGDRLGRLERHEFDAQAFGREVALLLRDEQMADAARADTDLDRLVRGPRRTEHPGDQCRAQDHAKQRSTNGPAHRAPSGQHAPPAWFRARRKLSSRAGLARMRA